MKIVTLGMLLLLAAAPAMAVKDIVIDWETGEQRISLRPEPSDEEATAPAGDGEKDVEELRRFIELQNRVILEQRQVIEKQRRELQRQRELIRGLDQLRRRGATIHQP